MSAGPSSSGRSGRRRAPRAPILLYARDGRIAGLRQRRLRRRRGRRRDRPRPGDGQRPRHPLRDLGRAGMGCGPRLRRDDRCPRRAGRARRGRRCGPAVGRVRRRWVGRRDATPRGFAARHVRPASARRRCAAGAGVGRSRGRDARRLAGFARSRRRARRGGHRRPRRGLSRTVDIGERSLFIEVFPVRPRLVLVGGVEVARSLVRLAKELGFETVVVDGRAAFATP